MDLLFCTREKISRMKILFVYSGLTGFIGDAWRALTLLPNIKLKVFNEEPLEGMTQFTPMQLMLNLDYELIYENESIKKVITLEDEAMKFQPDVMFIVGWHRRLSRRFAWSRRFKHVPKVLILDLPFAFTLKKMIAPLVLYPYLRRFSGCFVPKTSAVRYARWLGFKGGINDKRRGLGWIDDRFESINVHKFDEISTRRQTQNWPKKFLYVGRYAPEKGLHKLIAAYQRYRKLAIDNGAEESQLWQLSCCGAGSLSGLFKEERGVQDLGFVQPNILPDVMLAHGAFVIASLHEPWGAVIAEAAAAGLPIICTEACGAALDLVKENGIICKTGDVEDMARAMWRLHDMNDVALAEMGEKGIALAAPYSSENWALSCKEIAEAEMRRQRGVGLKSNSAVS